MIRFGGAALTPGFMALLQYGCARCDVDVSVELFTHDPAFVPVEMICVCPDCATAQAVDFGSIDWWELTEGGVEF